MDNQQKSTIDTPHGVSSKPAPGARNVPSHSTESHFNFPPRFVIILDREILVSERKRGREQMTDKCLYEQPYTVPRV
jgi:hypothetical protein